ncbi:MAG: glycine zipper 2TM domain-containing protein [Sulfuricella sp.]|nr:glycine zipper 2TM domain-containing protein [Sulfuricella sp.]
MNKLVLSVALLAVSAPPALAVSFDDVATVRSVTPQMIRVNTPRQVCTSEYIPASPRAERSVGGAILGGVAGAILGNQVGGGNGRTAATAVGAVTGAMVGDRMQNDSGTGEREIQRCHLEDSWSERPAGYAVTYRYGGREYTTVMQRDPGVGVGGPLPVRVSVTPE